MSMEASLATWELTKKDVNSIEKLLLLSFARRAGEEHTCWPSVDRISEDTGLDRKYIISNRQNLINKGFITYTGEMKGRSKQIPVMFLNYVAVWEQKRNSPRLRDDTSSGTGNNLNSTSSGTGTSTSSGTLNIKEETIMGIEREKQKPLSVDNFKTQQILTLCRQKNLDYESELKKFTNYYQGKEISEGKFLNWLDRAKAEAKQIAKNDSIEDYIKRFMKDTRCTYEEAKDYYRQRGFA